MIKEKIKTLIWFLKRPLMYPQLINLVRLRLAPNIKEDTKKESTEWCKQRATSSKKAVEVISPEHKFINPSERYAEIFQNARELEKNLPVQMGFGGDISLLYNLCQIIGAKTVVETGVAHGWSSLAVLLSFESLEGRLISTDMPYPKMNNEVYVGIVIPDNLKKMWQLIRKPDRQGLPAALNKLRKIDLCHYDSDKTYVGRKWAYPLLWKHLRSGGIFVSDDINDNVAFKEFAEEQQLKPTVVEFESKYIGILQKP
ncbi:MAG: class I SAM-dependent methyltransferase [bacterium]|nr:class I SAM-dependent methyltransferase [bacterium]